MAKDFFDRDMQLFIDHRVDWKRYFLLRRGPEVDAAEEVDTYKEILRTIGEVCESIEAGARGHWHEEVKLEGGKVVVPPHIAAGYEKLRAAGLLCLTMDPTYGGYGLPSIVNTAYLEMVSRADSSLMTIIGLQAGVAIDIEKYGSDALKEQYLPRFASGELQGAMDLTEPQAGSDLGSILTRVTQDGDRYFIDGEKIFITNGGAQVHLVLARDAASFEQSKGTTNGLSLMLCPATLPDGRANTMRVSRIESKLGIHGSPTCVIEFDRAEAFLLGKPGQGFKAMLDLMNNARLGVAAQALGIAEGAFHEARAYAEQRVQFGAPIIQQPLVKSMLTLMAINIAAARALLYRTSSLIDLTEALRHYLASERGAADPEAPALQAELERNALLVRFFTPLCKYYGTEISNHVTRQGIQVHGGLGYMAESVAGHYHSDSIITTIYEGTSEIQASFALKEMGKGALFTTLDSVRDELEGFRATNPELVQLVCDAIGTITESAAHLMGDPQYALLNAKRVAEMVIDVVASAELLCQAATGEPGKLELAQSYIHRHIPAVQANAQRISSGDASRIARYDKILGL
ncbi:MAG TPA: acyl-CoA dehydrogenase family protein [Candidatus Binatia bacterium]|jgi:alkylation response protein AidB-like acyl-CoA dehydrogenase|nr:acyl-CoA dehydrogenase family protein [Candidatus Binatia bacterium]